MKHLPPPDKMIRARLAALLLVGAALLPPMSTAAQPTKPGSADDPLAQNYEPAPAIWMLSDEDTTIYLFGTIHLLPEGFEWRSEQFNNIVEQVDELVLESSNADAGRSFAALDAKLEAVHASRIATSQQLSPSVRGKWRKLVEYSGASFSAVDAMPLPLAVLGFGYDTGGGPTSSYEFGVETVLEREFSRAGKPILSIENHAAVMLGLMRIDEQTLLRDLEGELARWPGKTIRDFGGDGSWSSGGDGWSMEHDWASGVVADEFDLGLRGKMGVAFNRVLLERRNTAWAGWLENRLDQPGTILVAVGAGHFEGADSVLEKLRARDLIAQRIN